ncbi:hypothetical protein G6O69_08685 [Pseudenhygromyxa sp. WMMC2535]|uniref:hypothetical protein n=1 Tax=Pseudenhygromyxa sp. WMMC2535 TaxID=2712867 RepID=UPI0015519C30|nr:hypothetical protein [Pseudenhygromyxa sp. WMMC2535]NVB37909.1 hypothetical protein [Pseudenhygromyxa sp. WMMC2535]
MANEPEPLIRGRLVRKIAASLERLSPDEAVSLRTEHDPLLQELFRVPGEGWVPQAKVMPLLETIGERLGPDDYFEMHRQGGREAVRGPLMSGIQDGSLRLFDLEPRSVLTLMPLLWGQTLRGCGGFEPVDFIGECMARATLRGVPVALLGKLFREAARGILAGTLDLCREGVGEVEFVEGEGAWVFEARWVEL